MRPSHPPSGKVDLFRERLEVIIDPRHPLVRLAGLVPWSRFDDAFGRFYGPIGRPAKLTRLMVGLHYLKALCVGFLLFPQLAVSRVDYRCRNGATADGLRAQVADYCARLTRSSDPAWPPRCRAQPRRWP